MIITQLTGRVDEHGHLEIDQHLDLPPGEVLTTLESINPENINPNDEAAADAQWESSFANSQEALARIAEKVRRNRERGLNQELDLDLP